MVHMDLAGLQSNVVLGYVRVSTAEQTRHGWSLGSQRQAIEDFCQSQGLRLVRIFEDPGRSGHSLRNRPGLLDLIDTVSQGGFGAVIIWREDRLGRRILDNQDVSAAITLSGTDLITLEPLQRDAGPRGDGAKGLNLRQLHQILAEHEWHQIRDRIVPNLAAAARKGIRGGSTPFGYQRTSPSSYAINKEEAKVVHDIFMAIESGDSIRSVAGRMKNAGVVDTKGRDLTIDRVRHMLSNRFYLGELVWRLPMDMQATDGDRIVIPDHHEGLIDPLLFERVQRRLVKQAPRILAEKKGTRKPHLSLENAVAGRAKGRPVHGILPPESTVCGHCGARMYARLQTRGARNNRRRVPVYECEAHKTLGMAVCPQPPALVNAIDAEVSGLVLERLGKRSQLPAAPALLPSSTPDADRRIIELEGQIERLAAALTDASGALREGLTERLATIRGEIERLGRERQAALSKPHPASDPYSRLLEDPSLWEEFTHADRRQCLRAMLELAMIDQRSLAKITFRRGSQDGAA